MRKKVDERIRTLIENGVKANHRSMFVIVGDKSLSQIVNLHEILSKASVQARPKILWCYKDKLELSSHKEKRAKQVKKLKQRGLFDPERADPLLLLIENRQVSHCLYKDSERILGNTFGMCVLQDFEALTPNVLARTIETVQGGGLIILLLRTLSSLSSLYTMVMDVHERFRTESHSEIVPRFNERFVLSLASCKACLVVDDELNILPISSRTKSIAATSVSKGSDSMGTQEELESLKEQLNKVEPACSLLKICKTSDQGKAVCTFLDDGILDKAVHRTIALTSSRGRGKSAALGLAIAGAIATGYSRIFVTAPSPENLKSLFDFVCRGLSALNYNEHLDYDLVTCRGIAKTITQINVYKQHNQIIQYIEPRDHVNLCKAELLIIDEAAAIPLPVVKSLLLGKNLVFISSTVNGYEGTGRSLSLKLFNHLEKQSHDPSSGNLFKNIELKEPIRYASGDPIESWLNDLLCLDATSSVSSIVMRLPYPPECNLYHVNRDTLFSFHKKSEAFLQQMVALYVSSHHQNSPDDLQVMADAPAHHLFVLLGPVDEMSNDLPDIFCVIQVCLEGDISRKSAQRRLQMGQLPSGDLIPWRFCEEFENTDFPRLSGVRIVRIAVHPEARRLGYGSAAVDLLTRYYEGKLTTAFNETDEEHVPELRENIIQAAKKVSLLEETIAPRKDLPNLLVHAGERSPERVNYIGASFELQTDLFRFWKKQNFTPFYISDKPIDATGEHSCIVLKQLQIDDGSIDFLTPFYQTFKIKFTRSLPLCFRDLDYKLAKSILDPKIDFSENETRSIAEKESSTVVKPCELKLLESFSNKSKDYEKVKHLVPILAYNYFFEEKIPITVSHIEASLLLCMGLQNRDITYVQEQMKLEKEQVLHLFRTVMVKFYRYFDDVLTKDLDSSFPQERKVALEPCNVSVDEDLRDGAQKVMEKMRMENVGELNPELLGVVNPELLHQYSLKGRESQLNQALEKFSTISPSGILSVKSDTSASQKRKQFDPVSKTRKRNKKY